jgi:hypothetical protein
VGLTDAEALARYISYIRVSVYDPYDEGILFYLNLTKSNSKVGLHW